MMLKGSRTILLDGKILLLLAFFYFFLFLVENVGGQWVWPRSGNPAFEGFDLNSGKCTIVSSSYKHCNFQWKANQAGMPILL